MNMPIIRKTFIVIVLFFICVTFTAYGKEINAYFEHISRKEGLPQVSVNVISQDEFGFLWFGTQGGLTRFDGYKFCTFKNDVDNQNSLSDNSVWTIIFGDDGIMWVGTNGGLSKFDRTTETFTNYRFNPKENTTLSDNNVRTLLLDSQGTLWVGTRNGGLNSCKLDNNDKTIVFKRYKHNESNVNSLSNNYIRDLYEDDKGRLWVATNGGGLDYINLKNKEEGFTHFKFDTENPESISSNNVLSIFKSKDRGLFIGTDNGLNRLKENDNGISFEHFKYKLDNQTILHNESVSSMVEDSQGNLWIGSNGEGLSKMDENYEFQSFMPQTGDAHSLSGNDVRSLYFDQQGLLWIGTYGNGLNKMDYTTENFSILKHNENDDKSLSSDIVLSVLEDHNDTLWIGTWNGGVNRLKNKKTVDLKFINDPQDKTSISGNTIWTMVEDRRGDMWFGTWNDGLNRLTAEERLKKDPRFIRYSYNSKDPKSLGNNSILSIYEDSRGILWIGTWGGGLNRLDPDNIERGEIEFKKYLYDPENKQSIGDNFIKTIMEDQSGNIWVGTWGGGMSMLSSEAIQSGKNEFKRYEKSWNDPNTLSHNDVTAIYQDFEGIFWISTYGGGLNCFNPKTEQFKCYTEKDGLSNQELYGVVEDSEGFLWISTNCGINKFDPDSETFEQYDVRDGLQGNEFNQSAFLKGVDGELYFGGVEGLSIFNPHDIVENKFIPPVYLTEFRMMHKAVTISESGILTKPIYRTDEITLNYNDATFGMTFSTLNYRQSDKNNFAYMLEGFDKEWIKGDYLTRSAQYTNVDPGTYIFRVKASNDDGLWNTNGVSLKITILPPWWKLWWVRVGGVFFIGSVLLAVYFRKISLLKKQQIYLEREVQSRTEQIIQQKKEILQKNEVLLENNILLKKQAEELEKLIRQDHLTGLLNRRGFKEKAQVEWLRAAENNTTFAIVMVDIDYFKSVNDQYGHDAGDLVLVNVANMLKNSVRKVDFVGRFGGEEFIILLSEIGKEEAVMIAEGIRKDIENMVVESNEYSIKITLTQGIDFFEQGKTIEQCIKFADNALYRGKISGRNRVEIWN
ncbi:diguanylate cyclase [Clostridium aestuarii]|uniref:Diguanylate cyclase n=1 Tax=Clostridium aestuarii TaxID=338193 RepID=A0ABT4CVG8_9CLOT|nr:ligand-binding sensor domain-containing diguanylate cyclase [Clostridium aestuarii]MCY6482961.1 diguanylate cyclase [Clostridium aestuarii]